jgi:hypothetical protein
MWYYYQATQYINLGYTALHLGQLGLLNDGDPGNLNVNNLITKIYQYAQNTMNHPNNPNNFVLLDCDGAKLLHVSPNLKSEADNIMVDDGYPIGSAINVNGTTVTLNSWDDYLYNNYYGTNWNIYSDIGDLNLDNNPGDQTYDSYYSTNLLLDFQTFPHSLKETILAVNCSSTVDYQCDFDYGTNVNYLMTNTGGISPKGYVYTKAPFLINFDNMGGVIATIGDSDPWSTWGYDEVSWFANLTDCYKNYWINYDYCTVMDKGGYTCLVGRDVYGKTSNNIPHIYRADGTSQESTIKTTWGVTNNLPKISFTSNYDGEGCKQYNFTDVTPANCGSIYQWHFKKLINGTWLPMQTGTSCTVQVSNMIATTYRVYLKEINYNIDPYTWRYDSLDVSMLRKCNPCSPCKESEESMVTSNTEIDLRFSLYPLPASDEVNLTYEINTDCNLDIAIYDIKGNKVLTIKDNTSIISGKYSEVANISLVPSGIYLVKVSCNNLTKTYKLVKIKN